jgi:hypothetical protein
MRCALPRKICTGWECVNFYDSWQSIRVCNNFVKIKSILLINDEYYLICKHIFISNFRLERKKEFLVRMNIAHFETRIPFFNNLWICSKHFKEEDFQYVCGSIQKRRRLRTQAFPTDWRDVYPDEVELVLIIPFTDLLN